MPGEPNETIGTQPVTKMNTIMFLFSLFALSALKLTQARDGELSWDHMSLLEGERLIRYSFLSPK